MSFFRIPVSKSLQSVWPLIDKLNSISGYILQVDLVCKKMLKKNFFMVKYTCIIKNKKTLKLGGKILNNTKYKIILSGNIILIAIIYIVLLMSKEQNQEISNYYIKENILNEPDTIFITKEDIDTQYREQNPEIEKQTYQKGESLYFIKVNCLAQMVTIYEKDENGYYSRPIKVMICSTGTSTPKGETYKTTGFKERWLALYGEVYGQYCTQIVENILFHSVPYLEYENPGSLEYLEYDKLGTEASLGCVRLKVEDAKWIFDNCNEGTIVEFYEEKVLQSIEKPQIEKISNFESLRNWDPTDDKEENPWKRYFEEENKKMNNLKEMFITINEINKIMKLN